MPASLQAILVLLYLPISVATLVSVLWLLWGGLKRTELPGATRLRTWGFVACVVGVWYVVYVFAAMRGFFAALPSGRLPILPIGLAIPVIAGMAYALRSKAIRGAVEAMPLWWLVGVQFYRVAGAVFVVLVWQNKMPAVFGYPAGYGDVAVGLLAAVVAWMSARGLAGARTAAYLWNILGLLDLAVALTTGFLSSPGPLQKFAFDQPNILISRYPLAMIPVFMVPLAILLHLLCLWKLRRQSTPAAH